LVCFEVAQKEQAPPDQGLVISGKIFFAILPFGVKCKSDLMRLMCSRVEEAEYSYKILFGNIERHLWC